MKNERGIGDRKVVKGMIEAKNRVKESVKEKLIKERLSCLQVKISLKLTNISSF